MSFHINPPTGMTLNPHHAAADQRNVDWVLRFNPHLVEEPRKLDRLRQARFSRLAAFTYPRVGLDELTLLCNWITWLFLHDDCWCDDSDVDEEALTALHTRVLATLRGELEPGAGDTALLHMLAELGPRMRRWADDSWMRQFITDVDLYLQSNRWEAQNRRLGLTPPLASYVKMRCFTGAMDTVFDCIELTEHLGFSQELLEHNAHNLVFVLRRERGLTLAQALEQAVAMHDAELRAFEWSAARLPDFAGELRRQFGAQVETAIGTYVAGLRSWMRGNIAWSWETPRYKGCLSMRGFSADV